MKKMTLILGTLCLGFVLSAQTGIIETRPANDTSGKILDMETTILSRKLVPTTIREQVFKLPKQTPLVSLKDGDIYLRMQDGSKKAIAVSEDPDITFGQAVSRNEFGIHGGIFVSPDSSKVAFYRNDESHVTSFPLLDMPGRPNMPVRLS